MANIHTQRQNIHTITIFKSPNLKLLGAFMHTVCRLASVELVLLYLYVGFGD
ncbi:hypothetical protein I79_013625 [Cricetulus griseus]|uniref:Uncharacterized protein n=1 Tax=Cricetulus griseus TaxID=10029 RepID=G3HS00_CRIGR|nr:hypothetical protein I79_013625 [Cricetulus griseus]